MRRINPSRLMGKALTLLTALLSVCLLSGAPAGAMPNPKLLVFAAASTTDVLTELGQAFQKAEGVEVVYSFASSSTLAKQIEQGAPADVYVSANVKWMDYLERAGCIDEASRFNLLRNQLALIAPADAAPKGLELKPGLDLSPWLKGGKLAMGDPSHVPAGIYAKQALEGMKMWKAVEGSIAAASNVRTALALVETGEAPLGVVYATDAAISKKVVQVAMFPADSHDPIVYPAAILKGKDSEVAKKFLAFLGSDEAKAVFKKYGFIAD